jgi:hypothetical protein
MNLLIHKLNPSEVPVHATGATLGQEHLRSLRQRLREEGGEIVVLDFSGIESATASYMKATIVWLIQSARLSVTDGLNHGRAVGPHDPVPLAIYPLIAGLSTEVREEIDDLLPAYRLPCLETLKYSNRKILKAALHGPLDDALSDTLRVLTECGSGTASSLHDRFKDRGISTTGWNNRLADLYQLRLAMRRKIGRQWIYEPVAAEVKNGREG